MRTITLKHAGPGSPKFYKNEYVMIDGEWYLVIEDSAGLVADPHLPFHHRRRMHRFVEEVVAKMPVPIARSEARAGWERWRNEFDDEELDEAALNDAMQLDLGRGLDWPAGH